MMSRLAIHWVLIEVLWNLCWGTRSEPRGRPKNHNAQTVEAPQTDQVGVGYHPQTGMPTWWRRDFTIKQFLLFGGSLGDFNGVGGELLKYQSVLNEYKCFIRLLGLYKCAISVARGFQNGLFSIAKHIWNSVECGTPARSNTGCCTYQPSGWF